MAREVLPWVGMAVGAYFGNPQLGFMIGSLIGNAVDPERIKGPSIGEGQTQTSREGVYRPIVLGIGCVAGNIINRGPEIIRIQKDRQGKGGPVIESERRYRTFAIRICEGPVAGILRIWENETLVYDARPGSGIEEETVQFSGKFQFYAGTEDQLPDPSLEAYLGSGNVNAYRGSAYIVFPNYDLTEMRDMIPQYRFEIASIGQTSNEASSVLVGRANIGIQFDASSSSANGISWNNPNDFAFDINVDSASIGNRIFMWSSAELYWTDDAGENWVGPFGEFGSVGGSHQSYTRTDTLIIPGGLSEGVFITQDGISFDQVTSINSNNCASNSNASVSLTIYEDICRVSLDGGYSWVGRAPPPLYYSGYKYIACNDFTFMAGGRSSNIDPYPVLCRSINNGMDWNQITFPTSAAESVRHIVPCGELSWALVMDNGELWYSPDGIVWIKANQELGIAPSGIAFNGLRAIVVGASTAPAKVMTAELSDLSEWTVRDTQMERITQIGAARAVVPDVSSQKIPLSSIVGFCHSRVYHDATNYDASALSDIQVDGVVFADGYSARDAITSVLRDYYTDAVECDYGSGYKIRYVRRGGDSSKLIQLDDLVEEPEETKREDAMERPKVLHLHFQSPIVGYAPAKASIQRISPDAKVSGEVAIQTPITYSDQNEAWRAADIMMRQAWTEVNGRRTFSLADNNLDTVPTDVLTVALRGRITRERVLKCEYIDGGVKLETIADRQSNYTSNVVGPVLPEPTPPPPSIAGVTEIAILDIPALMDDQDRLGYYVAATGASPGWNGAMVQRSLDGGASYSNLVSFSRASATVMGEILAPVSAASEFYTDTTNTVSVMLYRESEIESLTEQQFLSEGGAFALEYEDSSGKGWEILQYRDAVQDTSGAWVLSHLARGRLNTPAVEHMPGAKLVMLDGVQFVDANVSMLGQDIKHRGVSSGTSPEAAAPETMQYAGLSQTEWPVAQILASFDGSDVTITAIPRHRFGTEDRPVRSINWDGYVFEVTDGSNTLSSNATSASVTFDLSGYSSPITVSVRQVNRITGPGPELVEQFEW
jgi:hypothetical protein